jgi:hypothetical protein
VVALIDDDMAVVHDDFVHLPVAEEALDHGHVDPASRAALPTPDLANRLRVHAEEQRELCSPLIEQRFAVDQYQRAPPANSREIRADDRLPGTRRCDEHSGIVRKELSHGVLLDARQVTPKAGLDRSTLDPPVVPRGASPHGSGAAQRALRRSRAEAQDVVGDPRRTQLRAG